MIRTRCVKVARSRPSRSCRVEQFCRRGLETSAVSSPCDKHHAIRQQGCGVKGSSGQKWRGITPSRARRIVEFRASGFGPIAKTTRDQDLPIGQQRRGMVMVRRVHVTGGLKYERSRRARSGQPETGAEEKR